MQSTVRRTHYALILVFAAVALAQNGHHITTPKEALGFEIGDDYHLANYTQLTAWWKKLADESDRMKLVEIGKSEEGRPQWMAILTSPDNHKNLARYKEIARRLALAEGLTDDQAHALAHEGKAVVWIDGGLHATEVLGAAQLMEFVYEMVTRNDPETLRILNDVVILATQVNPDGMELVSNWYMRQSDPLKRSTQGVPVLWQKYIGHDNNRDFYMSNMSESTNANRQLYQEWFPQIMYNHHQTGPAGAVMFAPPFRDPFNYNFDPLIPKLIELVGSAMHTRFVAEGKPGTVMRSGASYSTWYNGGLRTTTYFHNMVGLLTETIGNPTPMEVPLVAQRQLPSGDEPFPVPPQTWHFRQSIEYSMTANRAVLDLASKYREDFLYNIYQMGRNSIQRGNQDSWTVTPKRIELMVAAAAKEAPPAGGQGRGGQRPAAAVGAGDAPTPAGDSPAGGFDGRGTIALNAKLYTSALHDPALRDPRGYILPADQPDFATATKFINTLIKNGVTVHRATADFDVAGHRYPAGSWVVKTAQAFRPHVLDMFEPQDHPNDFRYPGGPPIPPYDVTGYTLAYQMGVKFDRILDAFNGPFEKVSGLQKPPAAKILGSGSAGYLMSHQQNDAFIVVNRLLKNGDEVYWLKQPVTLAGKNPGPGTMYVPARAQNRALLEKATADLDVTIQAVAAKPAGEAFKLKPIRIGLWDQYGGSMPSGWLRWIFEQFEFPFELVYPAALDQGDLASRFDVLVFPSGAMPRSVGLSEARGRGGFFRQPTPDETPEEYRKMLGRVTVEKTIPQLKKFVESGGTIVTIGDSTGLAQFFGLPVTNGLVERTPEGQERPLPREKFYVPGSVLQVSVDNTNPVAYGMGSTADVFFENSPVFRMAPDAELKSVKPVAWFPTATPLRSGWAWGQGYLEGTVAAAEAPMGEGRVLLLCVEAAFRGQPHGTYKLLFNSIYFGPAKAVTLGP
ncbi:MAG TPA: M14 metallopeptidase family protein [Bryobacteraceae bacterium]|nr:M14 metallopeptidase family protein [Bryobacteraceae bacterium]